MGPFDEAILVSPGFGWKLGENDSFPSAADLPALAAA